jgi:hypothetical protein
MSKQDRTKELLALVESTASQMRSAAILMQAAAERAQEQAHILEQEVKGDTDAGTHDE